MCTSLRSEAARQHSEEIRLETLRLIDAKQSQTEGSQVESNGRLVERRAETDRDEFNSISKETVL